MSKADAVIVDKVGAEKIEGIGNTHGLKHKILVSNDDLNEDFKSKGWTLLSDLVQQNGNPECPQNLQTSSKDLMQIFFTSGTTGAPKMCAHTQGSYGYCHRITAKHWLDLTEKDLHWNIRWV